MGERLLVITVGTSLFHSASWEPVPPLDGVPGYRRWTEPTYLDSPRRRSTMCAGGVAGESVADTLESRLREWEPDALRQAVSRDRAACPGRYGAEVATLYAFWRAVGADYGSLMDFLAGEYREIQLVTNGGREDASYVAGRHLRVVLEELGGFDGDRILLKSVTGQSLVERMTSFLDMRDRQWPSTDYVDFVLSGGYKAFASLIGRSLVEERAAWRSVYLHEDAPEPVVEDCFGVRIDGRRVTTKRVDPNA